MYDLIIIGGGPAGLTASIYAIRKRLNVLTLAMNLGGKTNFTLKLPWIKDYQVIRGCEIISKFRQELEYLDFAHKESEVTGVTKDGNNFIVETKSGDTFTTKAVIFANGVSMNWLNAPGEEEFRGKGICYSAISYAPLFYDKDTLVYGEGDLALRSAGELSTIANKVVLVGIQPESLESDLGSKMKAAENVEILSNYQIKKIEGDQYASTVIVQNASGDEKAITTDCVFVEKELIPNTKITNDLIKLDEKGRIIIDSLNRTSQPGIFAAGDITNIYAEQILVAIGEGAKAALSAYDYLLRHKQL